MLTLVCLVEIAGLKSQLAQVDEALNRQASILISSDWSFGQADLETYTVPLTFTAVPNGLCWRLPVDQWEVDSSRQPVDTYYDQSLSIYDSQGNLLWSEDY